MLPSPTADATRFTGPERTSPQAKMPGTLVSSRYRSRSRRHSLSSPTSGPVSTYQRSSSAISGGSQRVSASAPMNRNSPPEASRFVSPVFVPNVDRVQRVRAPCCDHLRPVQDVDVRSRRELVDQVAGHSRLPVLGQRGTATEHGHAPRVVREEHRRLPSRVPGPDDVDVEAVRVRRLAARRSVEDALSDESLEPHDGKLPPRHTAREDDRLRLQHVAAVEMHLTVRCIDTSYRAGDDDLGAEPASLLQRSTPELVARDA